MTVDRPRHTEMRKAVQGFLTPRAVERWREGVRELVEGLLDARAGQSEMEFKEEIAAVVPRTFLFRLLDVPLADLDELFEITMGAHNGSLDPMRMYQIPAARQRIAEYYRPIVEHRSANPGDDLISMLVQGEQQGAFTRDEVYENIELFMLAGFGTTKRLLSNGMIAFCRHPEQWALLHGDPEGMVVSAVEECLRFDPAVKAFYRLAAVDTELGGKSLAAGERLLCVPASANRDPEVFDRPEEFDISRFPNQHVSFGGGVHHCLGAPLARMMAQETLKVLARRISQVRLTDEISYARNYLGHDPVSVPLAWTWA
ncbi:cytochrome P450 [Nocardioides sp. AN3]